MFLKSFMTRYASRVWIGLQCGFLYTGKKAKAQIDEAADDATDEDLEEPDEIEEIEEIEDSDEEPPSFHTVKNTRSAQKKQAVAQPSSILKKSRQRETLSHASDPKLAQKADEPTRDSRDRKVAVDQPNLGKVSQLGKPQAKDAVKEAVDPQLAQSKQMMRAESNQLDERKQTTGDELTPRKPKSEKIPDDSSVVIQPLITKVGSISAACSQKLRYHHPKNWQIFAETGLLAFSDFGFRCYYSKCFNKMHEWLGWWCTSDVLSILYSLYQYVAYMLVNTLPRSSNLSTLRYAAL